MAGASDAEAAARNRPAQLRDIPYAHVRRFRLLRFVRCHRQTDGRRAGTVCYRAFAGEPALRRRSQVLLRTNESPFAQPLGRGRQSIGLGGRGSSGGTVIEIAVVHSAILTPNPETAGSGSTSSHNAP